MEELLLGGLQDSVLKPEVVKYAVEEFSRQLEKSDSNLSHEIERAAEKKRTVEAELNRLVAAVADGAHSASLLIRTSRERIAMHGKAQRKHSVLTFAPHHQGIPLGVRRAESKILIHLRQSAPEVEKRSLAAYERVASGGER